MTTSPQAHPTAPSDGPTGLAAEPLPPDQLAEAIKKFHESRIVSDSNDSEHRRPARYRLERGTLYLAVAFVLVVICAMKVFTLEQINRAPFWGIYSVVVTTYILSRFVLTWCYRPRLAADATTYLPSVAIIVPVYNEPDAIIDTLRACLRVDYPSDLLTVVAVDDKSTDQTLERIYQVQAAHPQLVVVASPTNKGKRHAIATGLAAAGDAEILVFIDSDSIVEPTAVRRLVGYFADPKVGAVAGHSDVWNKDVNLLTRMQAVRYYVAFKVYKSAEALFGSVTCCSGCFSGYRRSAVDAVLQQWLTQTFLGQPSTYGDDRSLTNFLLRDKWKVLYAPDAQAYTIVPDRIRQFLRQQLRWKKSWVRETLRASKFMWRKHPIMSISFYLGVLLPFMAPQVWFRAFVVQPHFAGALPYWYLGGVLAMAFMYGLYYRLHHRERLWLHGVFFALFYTSVLVWQLPYAFATIRDSRWGTR
jgi:hyaluronan synthase